MTGAALLERRLDDILGPAEKRFFANGYRRVDYRFGEVSGIVNDQEAHLLTQVSLSYPGDWSHKASSATMPPHLSTVDMILLGAQMTDLCLTRTFGLDSEQRRAMWIRTIRIRAGSAPAEQLDDIDIAVRLVRTTTIGGDHTSEVDVKIGNMRVWCTAVHSGYIVQPGPVRYAEPAELLGPAQRRFYGTGFARGGHRIERLMVDDHAPYATAAVTLHPPEGADLGIEGAYQPSVTTVDCFVTALQLGQVLLYRLDGMTRAASNTLWMRSTRIDVARPDLRPVDPLLLSAAVRDARLVEMDGAAWRAADVLGELGAVRMRCAVTHRLPRQHLSEGISA